MRLVVLMACSFLMTIRFAHAAPIYSWPIEALLAHVALMLELR